MKCISIILFLTGLMACNNADNNKALQNRIDSLEKRIGEGYKPGLGEFMTNIQVHHAKLRFAGLNENWQLADFEIHEIMESIEDIKKYETDRPESKLTGILSPAMDSINHAIQQKDPVLFKSSYVLLTNTCNNCHKSVHFDFNVVTIPTASSFSNQDFRLKRSLHP